MQFSECPCGNRGDNQQKMPLTEENRDTECDICGTEMPEWRLQHTDECATCGLPRCRNCGQSVMNMEHTSDGGLCQPCATDIYGYGA